MSNFMNLFGCCGNTAAQKDMVVNITKKYRSESQGKDKKVFIKRSIGIHPIIDLSLKRTNSNTVRTNLENKNSKNINENDNKIHSANSIDSIHNDNDNKYLDFKVNDRSNTTTKSTQKTRRQISKFINYNESNDGKASILYRTNHQQQDYKQDTPLMIYQTNYRSVFSRKPNKIKEHQGINVVSATNRNCKNITKIKDGNFALNLDTIYEKQSQLPSGSQSQIIQMRQISSKSTLNRTNMSEALDSRFGSPIFQKYNSIMIRKNDQKPRLRINQSQNLFKIESSYDQEFQKLLISKLQMDNKILEMELKGLMEEQHFLKQQRQFNYEKCTEELQKLQFVKKDLKRNVNDRQKEIIEIEELIKIKQNY